jgi:hypothetical protein
VAKIRNTLRATMHFGAAVAASLAAAAVAIGGGPAAAATANGAVELQTRHGPVKGRLVTPRSSKEKPGSAGKRAHTPLRVIVPDEPVEPPRGISPPPAK